MCSGYVKSPWRWALPLRLVAVSLILAAVALHGASAQQQRLLVDFRALDADGQPVLDLKPADLVLRVDGRERPVASLELITRVATGTTPVLAPPFATNSAMQSGPRNVIVLIDR